MVWYPDTWCFHHIPCLTLPHTWSLSFQGLLRLYSSCSYHSGLDSASITGLCHSLRFLRFLNWPVFTFQGHLPILRSLITAIKPPIAVQSAVFTDSGNCKINIFGGHYFLILCIQLLFSLMLRTWLWVFHEHLLYCKGAKPSPLRLLFCPPQSSGENYEREI